MARVFFGVALCFASASGTPNPPGRLPVPELEVNLDLAPEERFQSVARHFLFPFRDIVNLLHAHNGHIMWIAKKLSQRRGNETGEYQREIQGWAKATGITEEEIHAVQLLYELNTLMVPIVNLTRHHHHEHHLELEDIATMLESSKVPIEAVEERLSIPIRVGCTGIIATDDEDGTVYHARNQDFSLAKYLQPLLYTGIFTRNGTEIFRAQAIAGYSAILTGMRKGPNGYAVEVNSRYTDHRGGNGEMFRNLFRTKKGGNKADLSGWTKRKILENIDNYEDAVEAFSTSPYVASEFNIVSGVKKGVVLARNPDGLAYKLPLNESGKKYVLMTNFDYPWHDIKENFDPSAVKGRYRRKAAEKILDQAKVLTPELLFSVINDDGVMAKDTIFQVIMNVELGLWNASLPPCQACGRNVSVVVV